MLYIYRKVKTYIYIHTYIHITWQEDPGLAAPLTPPLLEDCSPVSSAKGPGLLVFGSMIATTTSMFASTSKVASCTCSLSLRNYRDVPGNAHIEGFGWF